MYYTQLRRWLRTWLRRHLRLSDDLFCDGIYSLTVLTVVGLCFLSLSGCVTSYRHISDPRLSKDGYDFVCGGLETDVGRIRLSGDLCKNIAPRGGERVHVAVQYRWH